VIRLLAVASLAAAACAPAVIVRPAGDGNPTLFRVKSSASAVTLAGSMTRWRPVPLERRGGTFELRLALPPGRYEYRLEAVDDSGPHPLFPDGVERADDGFGGENAILRIR
jgi:hypothetical protein